MRRMTVLSAITVCAIALVCAACGRNIGIGDTVDSLSSRFGRADRSLLFVLSDKCAGCDRDVRVYQRLLRRRTKASWGENVLRFILVAQTDKRAVERFATDNGVVLDHVVASGDLDARLAKLKTPALVLINHSNRILKIWSLPLDVPGEVDLLGELFPFG